MNRTWLLVALTLGLGVALARTIRDSQVPPREMRPKRAPEPRSSAWTWARFDGDEPSGR